MESIFNIFLQISLELPSYFSIVKARMKHGKAYKGRYTKYLGLFRVPSTARMQYIYTPNIQHYILVLEHISRIYLIFICCSFSKITMQSKMIDIMTVVNFKEDIKHD